MCARGGPDRRYGGHVEVLESVVTTYVLLITVAPILRSRTKGFVLTPEWRSRFVGLVILGLILLTVIGMILFTDAELQRTKIWIRVPFYAVLVAIGYAGNKLLWYSPETS